LEPKVSERAIAVSRAAQRSTLKLVGGAAFAVVLLVTVMATGNAIRGSDGARRAEPPDASTTSNARVRVQVLNATTTRGLARRATMHLRDRGFDVLEVGTSAEQLDSSLVIDRSGKPERAKLVAAALGPGTRIETRTDSSRYLDVTVLLGRSWRPPAQPFYP
jgi:hypothetical protein